MSAHNGFINIIALFSAKNAPKIHASRAAFAQNIPNSFLILSSGSTYVAMYNQNHHSPWNTAEGLGKLEAVSFLIGNGRQNVSHHVL